MVNTVAIFTSRLDSFSFEIISKIRPERIATSISIGLEVDNLDRV